MKDFTELRQAKGFASYEDLMRIFGVAKITLHKWVQRGVIPPPTKVATFTGWDMGDLRAHLGIKKEAKENKDGE